MKKIRCKPHIAKIVIVLALVLLASCTQKKDNTLVIYSYDSLSWITESLTKEFETKNNCSVEFVAFETTTKMLTRLLLEKSKPQADLAIGFTPSMLGTAKKEKLIQKYKSPALAKISDTSLIFDAEHYTTPYDYGALAILYKPEKFVTPPQSFDDILKHKKSIIIQDPRTSSTGTDFLLWTIAVYQEGWQEFWLALKDSVITASPGWSESFAAFEQDEASMMVSYATDGAYSIHNYGSTSYKAFIPGKAGYIQIEGASVVKGCNSQELAEKFIDFMLSDEFQKEIPLKQWMFPATSVALPDVYEHAIIPEKSLLLTSDEIDAKLEGWLNDWEEIMTK